MAEDRPVPAGEGPPVQRVIGRYGSGRQGPLLVVMSALHGNEPAGVRAARTVLEDLRSRKPRLAGEALFLAGNLQALAEGTRFLERDLNRIWSPERIRKRRATDGGTEACPEDAEQRSLLRLLDENLATASNGAYFIDLHTSSADGRPFLTVGDTLRNRAFAASIPLPKILGLEEQVDGSLLEYLNNRGLITLGVEGGRHDDPAAEEVMVAVIRIVLRAAGMLAPEDAPGAAGRRELLRRASRGVPAFIEVRYRHPIRQSDRFRMEPGFSSFDPVRAGSLLARDRGGEILAEEDGLVLLPLYQGKGNDGYFLAREVSPFWMRLSATLRRLRLGRWLHLLPGVSRHRRREGVLVLDTNVTRWFPLEVLHILGYRKLRSHGNLLLASRRKYDLSPPSSLAP